MRDWIGRLPRSVVATLAIVIVVAVLYSLNGTKKQTTPSSPEQWFFDLETKQLVVHRTSQPTSPVTLPSGHEGVIAHVFSCGDCDDESQRFIGYMEKVSLPEQPTSSSSAPGPGNRDAGPQAQISADGDGWHSANSPQGMSIRQQAYERCGSKLARCQPSQRND